MASRPPLIALSYFEVAARTKSFTKAAAELHVTPAAISHQIKALEDFLGTDLFIRHHRKVSLTPAGREALPDLQEAFGRIDDAVEKIRRHSEESNIIKVCAEPLFATKGIIPRLQRFYALYPEAEVHLQASLHSVDKTPLPDFGNANLQRADIDIAVRLSYGQYNDLEPLELMPLTLVPMASPSYVEKNITAEDLIKKPLICDRTLTSFDRISGWGAWCEKQGITEHENLRTLQFSNGLLALEAAINGQGILLGSPSLLSQELDMEKLTIVIDQPLNCTQGYFAVCSSNSITRTLPKSFEAWLKDEFKSL